MERILVTDLDGTFVGDDAAMHALWSELDHSGVVLVFASGRHLDSIETFYAATDAAHGAARRAEACICMIGTEIWELGPNGYASTPEWSLAIAAGWDVSVVDAAALTLDGLEPQAPEWQSEWKRSYLVPAGAAATVAALAVAVRAAGVDAKVVHSVDRYVDVIPGRAGKGEAARYLAARRGSGSADVVTCGDSGNDLDMMRPELGFRSIVVGNAAAEMASLHGDHVYRAASPYAAGIREGLVHFGWLAAARKL
jgi:sucrose-phosphate synthase